MRLDCLIYRIILLAYRQQGTDPLEALERHVDFEAFQTVLMAAPGYGVRAKGGRPPYDPVTMFKVLVLASMHNPGDERMEFLIRDRLSWLRFPGFEIGEPTPDQKTIWLFHEKLTRSGAFKALFAAFENQLCERGYKPTGGQIVDATLVSAPRQRMRKEEKERARAGESASAIWPDDPARAAQKDATHAGRSGIPGRERPQKGNRTQVLSTFPSLTLATGTISVLTGNGALSGERPAPMRPAMMGTNWRRFWMPPTSQSLSGRIQLIAQPEMKPG